LTVELLDLRSLYQRLGDAPYVLVGAQGERYAAAIS
jgi:hypothetical protein